MLAEYTREEIAAALDAVAEDVLQQAGVEVPPVNAMVLARRLGISVVTDDRQDGRARYVRLQTLAAERPTIALRSDPRPERRQWAVAHEIGEHVAERVFARMGIDLPLVSSTARETTANQLAGRLLVPTAWLEESGRACGWELLALKDRFSTASHELIARRMLECRPAVIVRIFDQARLTFARSNTYGRVPPLLAAEERCWRTAHERGRPDTAEQDGHLVQCWPVHEDGWRREIMRTELRSFDVD